VTSGHIRRKQKAYWELSDTTGYLKNSLNRFSKMSQKLIFTRRHRLQLVSGEIESNMLSFLWQKSFTHLIFYAAIVIRMKNSTSNELIENQSTAYSNRIVNATLKDETIIKFWMCHYYLFTLISFASRESAKAGYCSSYLCTACWALRESTHKWQSAARKKYSFALYFSKELSNADAATWKKKMNRGS